MECRLLPATAAQEKYDTLFGEVVSAAADERAFVEGRWQFDDGKLNTLHHLGARNVYLQPGNALSQVNDSMLTDGSSALSSATVFLKLLKNQLDKLLCLPCLIIHVNYS